MVDHNTGVDIIRKKYHKYALLLHPDKNNHPKAEFAFKLVSEAYGCLSDESRRLEFDAKRWNNTCNECMKTSSKTKTKPNKGSSSPLDRSKSSKKISSRAKEVVKAKLREEARVIDKCLKANANIGVFDKEMPVFDPKDYYGTRESPHNSRVFDPNYSSSKWLKKRFNFENQVRCDYPVFEFKPNRSSSYKLKPIPMPI